MRILILISCLTAGWYLGHCYGSAKSKAWDNEGKTKAVTFLAYETYGLTAGLVLGFVLLNVSPLLKIVAAGLESLSSSLEPEVKSEAPKKHLNSG